jgi:hypothetical protein
MKLPAGATCVRTTVQSFHSTGKTNRNILRQYGILKMYNLQKE